MGKKKYPPLTPSEVQAIAKGLGFTFKRQSGSHGHYEKDADAKGRERKIITIDEKISEFDEDLLKSMIRQSGFTREEFYGATKRAARKASLPYLRLRGVSD